MKETFTNRTPLNFSSRSRESKLEAPAAGESNNIIGRSAAVLGLAISMGATGLLAGKPENAGAATSKDLPSLQERQVTVVARGTIAHEVKSGESLKQLAIAYSTSAEAIAAINNIPVSADIEVGQTIKIPTPEQSRVQTLSKTSEQLDYAENSLQETRKRLQESLVAGLSPSGSRDGSETVIVTETTALVPATDGTVEIQVTTPENSRINPKGEAIPIPVPTPDSERQISAYPRTGGTEIKIDLEPSAIPDRIDSAPLPATTPEPIEPRVIVPAEDKVYRVQPGDTLNTIARRLQVNPDTLARANGIRNPNLIKVNQALVVPGQPGQRVALTARNDVDRSPAPLPPLSFSRVNTEERSTAVPAVETVTATYATGSLLEDVANMRAGNAPEPERPIALVVEPPRVADNPPEPRNSQWVERRARDDRSIEGQIIGTAPTDVQDYNDRLRIPVGETVEPNLPSISDPNDHLPSPAPVFNGFMWPARGVLTSGFGWRWGRPHRGIDIAGPVGTPIVAAAEGEVISSGWNSGGYGNLVRLRHADGSVTLYAHNSRLLVRRGQYVERGQQIAEMGSTGFSTGPHLHFEIHPNGRGAVNPIAFLPGRR